MTADVERVATLISDMIEAQTGVLFKASTMDGIARAAMAATLELTAEALRAQALPPYSGTTYNIAIWLQQRANQVKETGRG